ncbi:hypothetical protein [uncultured Shimia sp.]|mgnify:CR=1 FL=1|uniref:hypothetical protein n=1 Tax=uncultured Shimia sp. TaxID=573152 RepID=UPI0025CDB36B|nr:hypothetical protein [uncultured Shimia sp.]
MLGLRWFGLSAACKTSALKGPNLSDIYRNNVTNLTEEFSSTDTKAEATTLIRSLIEEVRLAPISNGALDID